MRFCVDIVFKHNENCYLKTDYRKDIASLIKECLKTSNEEAFKNFYENKEKNIQKPFTFSLHIPHSEVKNINGENHFKLTQNTVKLYFSSSDVTILMYIYNGMINCRSYKLFNYNIDFKHFHLIKEPDFKDDLIVINTYSPVIVRDIKDNEGTGFLKHEDENFINNLKYSVLNTYKYFNDEEFSINDIEITKIKCENVILKHYGGEIGVNGIFSIKANKKILKSIYDNGFGAKRSQGFGMIEVIK